MDRNVERTERYVQFALWALVVLGGCQFVYRRCRKGKGKDLTPLPGLLKSSDPSIGTLGAFHNAGEPRDDIHETRKAPASIVHSHDGAGHPVIFITKPMLLARMEAKSGAVQVTPTTSRRSRIRSLTGIKDVGRLTEVMEQTFIPLIIRELSPNGVMSSGLMTQFDQGLCNSLLLDISRVGTTRLSEFTGRHTFQAVTGALFGPTFPSSSFEDYSLFVSDLDRLDGPFSSWVPATRKLQAARGRLMDAFANYLEEWWYADGLHSIPGISPLVIRMLRGGKDEELDLEEACGALLTFLDEAHMNLWSISLSLLSQILLDPQAQQRIVEDVRAEPTYCFSHLLESATQEALRWFCVRQPERHLDQDASFTIDGVQHTLKNGTHLILELSGLHFDADVYRNPRRFEISRFLDDSIPLPRPFGEGKWMCKGAHLATLQVKSFMYHVFRKCDLEVAHPGDLPTGHSPLPHLSPRSRLGVNTWSKEADLYITVKSSGV